MIEILYKFFLYSLNINVGRTPLEEKYQKLFSLHSTADYHLKNNSFKQHDNDLNYF